MKPMQSTIRPMSAADLPFVAALENAVHLHPWTTAQILAVDKLLLENYIGWVAWDDDAGVLRGYVLMQVLVDEVEILTIGVAKTAQGQGLGAAFLARAFDDLSVQNQINACLLEVRESNWTAIALYQKCGFVTIGRRKNYYPEPNTAEREDALLMRKNLLKD